GANVRFEQQTFPDYRVNGVDAHGAIQKVGSEYGLLGLGAWLTFVGAMALRLRRRAPVLAGWDGWLAPPNVARGVWATFVAHHVHRHLTPSILGPLRRHRVPVVWTVHDYELVCPNGQLYTHGAPCTRCKGHQYQHAVELRCKRDDLAQSAAVALEKWVHAGLG